MRLLIYTISGTFSALIGWSLSQIVLLDLPLATLTINPDIIILPIVTTCLSFAMIATEIFLSNPTRYKANKRILSRYCKGAIITGTIGGLIAATLSFILYQTNVPSIIVRVITWSLLGLFIGLGEATSWKFRSVERGTSKAKRRIVKVLLFGLIAGLTAALYIEIIRQLFNLGGYEDPIGFLILGLLLGVWFSQATSPTYQIALRAGQGFEAVDPKYTNVANNEQSCLNSTQVRFVSLDNSNYIEEGLSIQLPTKTKQPIVIGSSQQADIIIPALPEQAAAIEIHKHHAMLKCLTHQTVQVQAKLLTEGKKITLRHNNILTLFHASDENKYYRFVFYDQFLDPEA